MFILYKFSQLPKRISTVCHSMSVTLSEFGTPLPVIIGKKTKRTTNYQCITQQLLLREHRLLTIFSHYPKSSNRREHDVTQIHEVAIHPVTKTAGSNDLFLSQNNPRVEQHGYNF